MPVHYTIFLFFGIVTKPHFPLEMNNVCLFLIIMIQVFINSFHPYQTFAYTFMYIMSRVLHWQFKQISIILLEINQYPSSFPVSLHTKLKSRQDVCRHTWDQQANYTILCHLRHSTGVWPLKTELKKFVTHNKTFCVSISVTYFIVRHWYVRWH